MPPPFDAGQIIALLEAAKTTAEVAAGAVALIGGALVATLWRMHGTLTHIAAKQARDEEDIRDQRRRFEAHEEANSASFRRVHERLDATVSPRR